jgi:hypothetical protein
MSNLFDDPGDLGFFDKEEEDHSRELELENDFYEPAPGEEVPGVKDNGDGTASFVGTLRGMGF